MRQVRGKLMRKILRVLVVAMIISSAVILAGCGSDLAESKYCGRWEADKAAAGGIEMDADKIFEDSFTLELKDTGECVLTVNGEKTTGKWEEKNGKAVIDGEDEMSITEKKGKLVLEYSGMTLYFIK